MASIMEHTQSWNHKMNTAISEKVLKFYNQLDDKNHRYLSWEHCYNYFNEPDIDVDKACLHLAFYLASLGMYRGSSFLLWKDYLIHKEVVEKIISVRKNFQSTDFNNIADDDLTKILTLCDFIGNWYKDNSGKINGEVRITEPSSILISKIILGTLGCLPAYDRFFLSGLEEHNISPKKISIEGLKELIKFYKNNKAEFDSLQTKVLIGDKPYPVMKLIDMYFWQIGFDKFNKSHIPGITGQLHRD